MDIGAGVTRDVQVNNTTDRKDSKAAYRKKEMQLTVLLKIPTKFLDHQGIR